LGPVLPETQFFYGFFIFEIHIHPLARLNPLLWIELGEFDRIK
jgi:hypothetical protein